MQVIVENPNTIVIDVDQGRQGRGIQNITYTEVSGQYFLIVTYTDGTTETLGPLVVTGGAAFLLGGATGSIPYQSAPNTTVFLPIGTQNQVVVAGATTPQYTSALTGLTVNNSAIGNTAPSTGAFTNLSASGTFALTGDQVQISEGGTGQTTANGAFNALAPSQTGNAGKYLKTDGTNTAWDQLDISTADITGTLPIANGGTGQTTANSALNALLPTQAAQSGKYLKTDGTNASWDQLDISTADITGVLPVANGGTGASTAAGARANLSAAILGTNNDITSMTGVTGGISTPDFVQFDTTATEANAVGKVYWDAAAGTLDLGLLGGNVVSRIGQSLVAYVTNAESVTITKGQAVYLFSAQGNRASVKLASNLADATSAKTFGVVAENIAANGSGFIMCQGVLDGLNLGAYTAGDTLYLGATPGSLTATKPYAPNHLVYVGLVERANAGNGQLYVKVQNGYELDEIHDVQIINPQNGQTIIYDASTSLWKNANLTAGSGISVTNGAASITVSNTGVLSFSGGTTGLTPSTSTTGAVTLGGTLNIASGGTGQTTANASFNALAPSQTGNAGKYLKTDGTNSSWDLLDISTSDITGTLPVANGGTGATTAAGALTNLNAASQSTTISAGTGLTGGGDLSTNRTISIANTTVTAGAYGSASDTLTATVNAQGQLTALAATPIAIANTQISGLGTMSTQNASSVSITGGTITGITDLAVADGGTGASDASTARSNLGAAASATTISAGTGLSGGGDLSANRTLSIANTTVTAGAYGSASNTLTATVNAQGQLTALAATPIAIANTQISGLGTMSTQNSNSVTITGGSITGITDLAIADGGTGASTASGARTNLGLGTSAVLDAGVALGVATLDAGGTVPLSQLPASIQGGVSYQGSWDAATNTPTIVSSVGSKGYYYVVSVAGSTNINGITDWLPGDWIIFNGSVWQKIDNTDAVASVNGYTGVVVLNSADVGAPPTSRTITAGTGLTGGGDLSANRTISIANTTVAAGSYGSASSVGTFTVNGQGQLTAATSTPIAITNTQVSGLGTMSTQNAGSVAITGGTIDGTTIGGTTRAAGSFTTLTLTNALSVANGGTGTTTSTGTGSVVLSSSPTLTTPNLGTPSAATLTNATGLPLTTGVTGTLPIANGGTNGTATPTAGAVAYGTGTAYAFTPAGTSNQVLISNGAAAPSWANLSSLGVTSFSAGTTGLTPSTGTAGAVTLGGTLNVANGGTGLTSLTSGYIPYGAGTSAFGFTGNLFYDSANVRLGIGGTNPATTLSVIGATSTTLGFSISPGGWNNARHRLTVPISGDTSVWSFNYNGSAVDFNGYATSSITIGQGNVYIAVGTTNTAPSNVAAFSTNLLAVTGAVTSTLDATIYGLTVGRGAGAVFSNTAVGGNALAANTTGDVSVAVGYNALNANLTGNWNVAVGKDAMLSNTTGYNNTALNRALATNISGSDNTALGFVSLYYSTGSYNTAVGSGSLFSNLSASYNTAVGYQAGYSNQTGANQLFVGRAAGYSTTTGGGNTALGDVAFYYNISGTNNVAVGTAALQNNNSSSNNTAVGYQAAYLGNGEARVMIGYQAGYSNQGGNNSIGVGFQAVSAETTGSNNIGIGYQACSVTNGYANVAVGTQAMNGANAGAYQNTAIGQQALRYVTSANNTAVGYQAGYNNTTATQSVYLGVQAGYTGGADRTVAVGYQSLYYNIGDRNTAVGWHSMVANVSGGYNTAVGTSALQSNTTASNNTAFGYSAAYSNQTGNNNTSLGAYTGYSSNGGADNTFVGHAAGYYSTTGTSNVVVGFGAFAYQNGAATGSNNVAIGREAMAWSTTASSNTAVGTYALYLNQTGINNTALGQNALYYTTGASNIGIGVSAGQSGTGTANIAIGSGISGVLNSALSNQTGGSYNIAIGSGALSQVVASYSNNTAVGHMALFTASGSTNTAIGYQSGSAITTGSKNTILGSFSGNQGPLDIRTANNYIVLSDGDGNPRGVCDNNGKWNFNSVSGNSYTYTSTSGGTAITDTGIYYNTSVMGYGNGPYGAAVYDLYMTGNPNAGGSSSYKNTIVGYIIIVTGYDFGISNVINQVSFVQTANVTSQSNSSFTLSVVFWNGSTESSSVVSGTTNAQIRIKVSGYNASYTGDAQQIYLTKRL